MDNKLSCAHRKLYAFMEISAFILGCLGLAFSIRSATTDNEDLCSMLICFAFILAIIAFVLLITLRNSTLISVIFRSIIIASTIVIASIAWYKTSPPQEIVTQPLKIQDPTGKIAAGNDFSMLLRSDKTVVTYGAATGIDTSGWKNITQISAYQDHAIGLREDKTVVVAGANMVEYDVRDWSGIVQVAACMEGVLGLTENGIVRFAGPEKDCRIECKNWTNIQRIIGAAGIIVAQQMDGRLVAVTCQEDKGYISTHSNSRIVSATAVCDRMLYVFENGRVEDMKGSSGIEKVATTWVDMKQVAVGSGFAIGLKQDGSVTPEQAPEGVSFDVSKWENVVAICAGKSHALGLCADGSVVTEGDLQGKLRKIVDVNYWVEY